MQKDKQTKKNTKIAVSLPNLDMNTTLNGFDADWNKTLIQCFLMKVVLVYSFKLASNPFKVAFKENPLLFHVG